MTIGLIAFFASFLAPLAYMGLHTSAYVRTLENNSERHANERIEQQGLGAVVTKLERQDAPSESKLAA